MSPLLVAGADKSIREYFPMSNCRQIAVTLPRPDPLSPEVPLSLLETRSTSLKISLQGSTESVLGRVSRISGISGIFKGHPLPPRTSIDDAPYVPEASARFMDLLTFGWVTPLLSLGNSRPLQASDLYVLQPERGAAYVADRIEASFTRRQKAAEDYNSRLARGDVHPGPFNVVLWMLTGKREEKEKRWRELGGRKNASLALALNDSVKWWFWSGGVLKVFGDIAQVTSPLLVKVSLLIFISMRTGGLRGDRDRPSSSLPQIRMQGTSWALLSPPSV